MRNLHPMESFDHAAQRSVLACDIRRWDVVEKTCVHGVQSLLVSVFVIYFTLVSAAFFTADQQAVERVDIGPSRGYNCVCIS